MGGSPAISVLVPVYNVERYLEACLDSLVAQSFANFEVICINDGSTDGSRTIIDRYLNADSRFRVIDKENSGYGASMNRGLAKARGTYVAILESDDFFEPDALGLLHDAANRTCSEVTKANYWLYWSERHTRREPADVIMPRLAGRTLCPADDDRSIFLSPASIWSAIYRRDFLERENVRFLETPGASYQDTSFAFKVWALAKRATFIANRILDYRQDNEASSVNSPTKVFCVCDEYAEMERFLGAHPALDAKLRGTFGRMKVNAYLWNARRLSKDLRVEFVERVRTELQDDVADGRVDLTALGVRKATDVRYLIERPDRFLAGIDTAADEGVFGSLRHYRALGGMGLVLRVGMSKLHGGH